jgi:DNA-binding MarR family transcriptional regulator
MSINLPCYCATLRRAARIVSQKYDAALRPLELTITQFTLLTLLAEVPAAPRISDLVEALAMDQTTLSRTLKLMEEGGLIARQEGTDRRESRWVLTARGRSKRRQGLPHWTAAQKDLEKILGLAAARQLSNTAFTIAERLTAAV